VSLTSVPTFTALSYIWGSITNKQRLIMDESEVMSTANLATGLQYKQEYDEPIILWVYALCIYVYRQRFLYHRYRWHLPPILVVCIAESS